MNCYSETGGELKHTYDTKEMLVEDPVTVEFIWRKEREVKPNDDMTTNYVIKLKCREFNDEVYF